MNEKLKFCKLLGTNINVITMNETVIKLNHNRIMGRVNYFCVTILQSRFLHFLYDH